MRVELDSLQARVIGCLIEKQVTTPDQYPLSVNALVSACNQKSNRDPVMNLDEPTVQGTLDALSRKHLVLERSGFGSRVPKYQQLFCNTEYGTLKFSPQELAVVCELLLRGPQTPGELRSRAGRMASFTDVSEVEAVLQGLQERESGPLVARLAREPGRRESRYMQLFGGEPVPQAEAQAEAQARAAEGASSGAERETLETRVARLETELMSLRAELQGLKARGQ
ncbi:MAG: YceH family protein [Steroidobacteraceae bacterium]